VTGSLREKPDRKVQGSTDVRLWPRADAPSPAPVEKSGPFVSATEPGLVSIVPKVDGRRLRSERTRQALIEAFMRLLRRKPAMPTAFQIAQEAGCSVRSVFGHFPDLDALSVAAADYAIVQGQREAVARNVDADRTTRIHSHVETRAFVCEKWLPLCSGSGPRWYVQSALND